jgi:hypothetical protein
LVTTGDGLMNGMTGKVYRDGSKALVETAIPGGQHTLLYVDIPAHKNWSVDVDHPSAPCTAGSFTDDWGDPFAGSAGLLAAAENSKPAGTETLNGIATKVIEADFGGNKAKFWVDRKYGLLIKWVAAEGSKQTTMAEVKQFSTAKPPAAVLALPSACLHAKAAGTTPAEAETKPAESKPAHQVTAVHLDDPPKYISACPAKIHFTGTIATDGPGTVWFQIAAGQKTKEGEGEIKFAAAGTKNVSKDLIVSTSPGEGGGMALLEAAMEDDQGRHGDIFSSKNANDRFYYNCK